MKITHAVAALAALSLAAITPARAEIARDVFTVVKVPVRGEGSDATQAKRLAQSQGRRVAVDRLLRRLTPKEDWEYLPTLAAGRPAPASGLRAPSDDPLSPLADDYLSQLSLQSIIGAEARPQRTYIALADREMEALESGIEIFNEKNSATTYSAQISYSFKPSAVRKLLRDAQLPYSEVQARAALVLPVFQTPQTLMLWEPENPWAMAWRARPLLNELTPMLTPLGDLEDITDINPRQALALNQDALSRIAERYNIGHILVAHGRLLRVDGQDRLQVRLINAYNDLPPADAAVEEAVIDGMASTASTPVFVQPAERQVNVGEVLEETWMRAEAGGFAALAESSIDGVLAGYGEEWKQRTLIDHSAAKTIVATAHFRNAKEWMRIRSALIAAPIVEAVQVQALSRDGAYMSLRYLGETEQLRVALEQNSLGFWSQSGAGVWNIAAVDLVGEVKARQLRAPQRPKRGGGWFRSENTSPGAASSF